MRSLQEILHNRVILFQKCLHLLNQVFWLFLSPFVFVSESVHLIIKLLLNRFKLDMEAFFVQLNIGLQIALVRLIVIDVIME